MACQVQRSQALQCSQWTVDTAGNSGGVLLDGRGRLIGINTAIASPSGASNGVGFAIPIDAVKGLVDQVRTPTTLFACQLATHVIRPVTLQGVTGEVASLASLMMSDRTARADVSAVCQAPIPFCRRTQVLTYGRVVRPVLGITLAPPQAARQLGQEGVLALEVMPGSPAYKADLHPTYRCCDRA